MVNLNNNLEVSRKVAKEVVLLFGSRRALLLQVAHPLVSQGAKHHSNFRQNPLKRFYDTLDFSMTMVFGNEKEKKDWIRKVNRMHEKVKGIADDPELEPNTRYYAKDPNLLLWVHTTLIDTAIVVYDYFVGTLTTEEKNRYCQEAIPAAVCLGIPEEMIPTTYVETVVHINKRIKSGEVRVTEDMKKTMKILLYPYPVLPKAMYNPLGLNTITAGLLPPAIREGYGLKFGIKESIMFEALTRSIRRTLPYAPGLFRTNPYARDSLWGLRRLFSS